MSAAAKRDSVVNQSDNAVDLRADPATRVGQVDWPTVMEEVNAYGCALTPQLLSPAECKSISGLYDEA